MAEVAEQKTLAQRIVDINNNKFASPNISKLKKQISTSPTSRTQAQKIQGLQKLQTLEPKLGQQFKNTKTDTQTE